MGVRASLRCIQVAVGFILFPVAFFHPYHGTSHNTISSSCLLAHQSISVSDVRLSPTLPAPQMMPRRHLYARSLRTHEIRQLRLGLMPRNRTARPQCPTPDLSKHREANGSLSHQQSLGVPSLALNSFPGLRSVEYSQVASCYLHSPLNHS